MPTDSSAVLEERRDDVVTITLDRPEKRNALAVDVMEMLTAALRRAGDTDALGVVIAANGPVFSAGHNFGDPGRRLVRGSAACLRRVHRDDDDDPGASPAGVRDASMPWQQPPVANWSPAATSR